MKRLCLRRPNLPPWIAADLIDEAPTRGWTALMSEGFEKFVENFVPRKPGDDPARAYVGRALRNRVTDECRRQARERDALGHRIAADPETDFDPGDPADPEGERAIERLDQCEALRTPFSQMDLHTITRWATDRRQCRPAYVLLSLSGLAYKLQADGRSRGLWTRICQGAAGQEGSPLPEQPLPLGCSRKQVADALGVSEDAIYQIVHRRGPLLKSLEFWQTR